MPNRTRPKGSELITQYIQQIDRSKNASASVPAAAPCKIYGNWFRNNERTVGKLYSERRFLMDWRAFSGSNDRINIATEVKRPSSVRRNTPLGTESLSQLRIGTQINASGLRFDTAAVFGLTRFSPRTESLSVSLPSLLYSSGSKLITG